MKSYSPISLIYKNGQYGLHSLFLSDAQAANDHKILNLNKIITIISIGSQAVPPKKYKPITYHAIPLHDRPTQNALQHIQQIIGLIQKSRQNGNVLVHCYHGVSRSATFVIAYAMYKQNIGCQQAKLVIKSKRNCIGPNKGFIQQLKKYQLKCLGDNKNKQQQIKQKTNTVLQ